jgi:hypothetical protein
MVLRGACFQDFLLILPTILKSIVMLFLMGTIANDAITESFSLASNTSPTAYVRSAHASRRKYVI